MNKIFHDYLDKFIVVYLDDILIFSRTVEEDAEHLKLVLGLLRQHQYKVNLEKCEFGRTKILYLGHEISADGLRPDDAKVASIRDWPRPQTVTEVKSFLGMTGYYRPFVKNYSTTTSPLTDLTRLDTPWEWTEECEATFRKLKYALTHYETKYYGGSREKMLETMQGIGAQGCEFLVAGRVVSGNFQVLSGIELPPELASIFKAIPESVFRKDISSTEIRQRMMQSQAS
ncbi:hypothetical protein CBR_g39316 [Chara braunii]|uniref:Reverse transcriptase domain-containing protein n=1 Tax=Chara braunii TaxID=69332 RepID=A0A388K148_CHABU|nr:hypothetical protein CBR_g39316 [Chara braunii]|eukprot:GBG63772.1 hypothetical protein CBR_g39316 [Chara braunii]